MTPELPRYVCVDLILSERDMSRAETAVARSGLSFVGYVRQAVRLLGVTLGVEFPEFKPGLVTLKARNRARGVDSRSKIRHSIMFPSSWHVPLNETARLLGFSKAGVVRTATMRRVNGFL